MASNGTGGKGNKIGQWVAAAIIVAFLLFIGLGIPIPREYGIPIMAGALTTLFGLKVSDWLGK